MDVPEDKRIIVRPDDPLNNFINNPISGEEKFVFLYLGDHREKFVDLFMDRFQDYFMVLSPEDILDLSLLGPDVLIWHSVLPEENRCYLPQESQRDIERT